jgi:hypothetical protein
MKQPKKSKADTPPVLVPEILASEDRTAEARGNVANKTRQEEVSARRVPLMTPYEKGRCERSLWTSEASQ